MLAFNKLVLLLNDCELIFYALQIQFDFEIWHVCNSS